MEPTDNVSPEDTGSVEDNDPQATGTSRIDKGVRIMSEKISVNVYAKPQGPKDATLKDSDNESHVNSNQEDTMVEPTTQLVCEPCKLLNTHSFAYYFCSDCQNELLCQRCSDTHRVMKSTRSHALLKVDKYESNMSSIDSFCEPCLNMKKTSHALYMCQQCQNELLCKSCSETHKVMKSTNSHILLDVKTYHQQNKPKGQFCEPCATMKKITKAINICKQCENELLCKRCSDTHQVMKSTFSHILLDINDYLQQQTPKERFCDPCAEMNKTSTALYVCQQCENELLCKLCSDTHKVMKSTGSHNLIHVEVFYESNTSLESLCEPCSRLDKSSIALFVCQQCENELLCKVCADTHKILKATRSHVLEDIETYHEQNKPKERFCEQCAYTNKTSPAVYFCQECENELLCKGCADTHRIMKATRSHVLVDVKNYVEKNNLNEQLCEVCANTNKTSPALYVCQQCENELLCKSCADMHRIMKATRSHILVDVVKYNEQNKPIDRFCEECVNTKKTSSAVYVCQDCNNEFLCKSCAETHRFMKATRSHVLLDVEKYTEANKPNSILCDPCTNDNKTSPALYVCQDCENELLCKSCADTHQLMKATRSHVLVDVVKYNEQNKPIERFCEECVNINKTSPAVYVCQDCENEFLCKSCTETHRLIKATCSHVLFDVGKYIEANKPNNINCEPCTNNNKTSPALYVCQDCEDELLCKRCADTHKLMKATRSHVVVDLDKYNEQSKPEKRLCDHCGRRNVVNTAVYMCQQCDNDLLCEGCVEKHKSVKVTRSHTIQPIDELKKPAKFVGHLPVEVTKVASHNRRKPGRPTVETSGVDYISLRWSKPDAFDNGEFYQINFKENSGDSKWEIYSQQFTQNKATVKGLTTDCEYIFRVNCVNGEGEGSHSDSSDPFKIVSSPASRLVASSKQTIKSDVSPTMLSLPTTENTNARNPKAKTRKLEIGPPGGKDWDDKTIMVIGETGTGKSTFVDGLVNYILGVNWTDPYRLTIFNLEDEENSRKHNQALSQTEWITCYKVNLMAGSRIQYSLNIIDTPGFGDTRGLERDNAIVEQIRELFTETEPKGILTIDAVCFVIKAVDARLTSIQRYIFQSIMSLFGKDIEHNICSMVTFAVGIDSPVFAALDELGLPLGKRLIFNNSGLYAKNTNIDQFSLSLRFWNMNMDSFDHFFKHLENMQRKSLRLTSEVLNERNRLETTINNLEPKLDARMNLIEHLKKVIKCSEDNKYILDANKDFSYVIKKIQQIRTELPKGQQVTNCTSCSFTCHVNCTCSGNNHKRNCCVMNANGYCTMCPDKCFWDKHVNTAYVFKYEIVEETKTCSEMKKKYEDASAKKLTQDQLEDKLRQDLEYMAKTIEDMMDVIMDCNARLAEIALVPNPLTMKDHIDLMIENEKCTKREGWLDRIKSIEKLKKRARILDDVDEFSKKAKTSQERPKDTDGATKSKQVLRKFREVFGL